jgi:hypothetical protein
VNGRTSRRDHLRAAGTLLWGGLFALIEAMIELGKAIVGR